MLTKLQGICTKIDLCLPSPFPVNLNFWGSTRTKRRRNVKRLLGKHYLCQATDLMLVPHSSSLLQQLPPPDKKSLHHAVLLFLPLEPYLWRICKFLQIKRSHKHNWDILKPPSLCQPISLLNYTLLMSVIYWLSSSSSSSSSSPPPLSSSLKYHHYNSLFLHEIIKNLKPKIKRPLT